MDFWEVIARRHSVRAFASDRDVPDDIIERVLDAAVQAPSAGNLQSWHFIIVRNQGLKSALAQAAFGRASNWRSRVWSPVNTRAYPNVHATIVSKPGRERK